MSAATDRRWHLAVHITYFLLRCCTKSGILRAEAEVLWAHRLRSCQVWRTYLYTYLFRILWLTHGVARYGYARPARCCVTNATVPYIVPWKDLSMLVSATCEKFVSAFLVLGAEEGGEDRVLLAEKAAQGESNVLCVIENMLSCFFSSRGT
jgi:hypothetical protein